MARVYIETTIPSFYFETRRKLPAPAWRAATRLWWDQYRHAFELCTSEVVLEELSRAPAAKSMPGRGLLDGVAVLPDAPGIAGAAAYYIEHRLVPHDALADALHLAYASVHAIDYLLTWNCRHLANVNKTRHLAVLNDRLGLPIPVLTTPLTLLPEVPGEEAIPPD